MEHLSNDHKDHPNQHENSHKLCNEMGHKMENNSSHRARMSREFDSRKDSHSPKFKQRPLVFVKLSFRELCDSKLSG